MRSISFDFDSSDLEKSLKIASRQFPASAEIVLKKESRNIAKDLKGRVDSEAKGHHYAGQGATHKPLAESFRQGKVMRSGSKVTVAVTTTAPHYHLYEEGHAMITHKSKNGTHGLRQVGEVKGKKTVAKYMSQRADHAELIGQELLQEILKEAGFDS
ncbi:MAG: putative tail-component [Bacteriophage sp.]|nr:MAG: putative tail-component [Bacteriophage sp.]